MTAANSHGANTAERNAGIAKLYAQASRLTHAALLGRFFRETKTNLTRGHPPMTDADKKNLTRDELQIIGQRIIEATTLPPSEPCAADQKHMTEAEIVEGLAEALFNDAMDSVDRVLRWKDGGAARPEALRRAARVAIAYLANIGQPSAAARIAAAPRAWAVKMPDGTPFHVSFATARPDKYLVGGEYAERVALVPLTEKEASQ